MEISEQLLCLFSAKVEQRDGSYIVEVPEQELRLGQIDERSTYQIAVLSTSPEPKEQMKANPKRERGPPGPPIKESDHREVEIEGIGEQGDGIARVERGFIVIVPDTEQGERVTIEITDVRANVAFAEVVERLSYYD